MTVCKFWQKGFCRNGENCKFEHPGDRNVPNINQSNRFAPLQNADTSSNTRRSYGNYQNTHHSGTRGGIPSASTQLPYGLDKDAIITDLTTERPQWILSAYGPGRMAPAQLFGGPLREQSFEEMRLLYHLGLSSGNPQQAIQHANQLQQAAEQQIETVLRDIDGAISYIIDSEKTHPNRIDICRGGHLGDAISQPLGQPSTTANFPLANRASVNMQPTSGSSFGPTSGIGGGSFGKPSVLNQGMSPFGMVSTPGTTLRGTGTFGQPSLMGQPSNPFGSQSQASMSGSTSNSPAAIFPTPASNAFGQQPQPPASTNPFGSHSGTSLSNQGISSTNNFQKNPFGNPSGQSSNSFHSNAPTTRHNPFATTSGMTSHNPSNSGNQGFSGSGPATISTPMNQFNNSPGISSGPLTEQGYSMVNTDIGRPSLDSNSRIWSSSRPPMGRDSIGGSSISGGRAVHYKDGVAGFLHQDGRWERIWFPDGPPPFNKDAELGDESYDENTKAAYQYVLKSGTFKDSIMPLLPPKMEWCSWDF